jgi:hypothetical protein
MLPISTVKQGLGFGSTSVASLGFLTSLIAPLLKKKPIPQKLPRYFHQGTRFLLNNQFNK